jgi:peptide subunit release factor 1 (eRF1)
MQAAGAVAFPIVPASGLSRATPSKTSIHGAIATPALRRLEERIRMSDTGAGTAASTTFDIAAKLQQLARLAPGRAPVISVYLDTRWTDEHQRERVRVFLKNETRKAAAMAAGRLEDELAWIAAQGERLVRQEFHPDAAGVAMFVGGSGDMREILSFAVPFTDTFTMADIPRLRPLVAALGEAPRAAVLFVDGESARVIALTEQGAADEIALETTDVIGQHRRGGWLLLLQSRYQRHIHELRKRHFDAVADALAAAVDHYGLRAIVLAGEARNLAVFRTQVPPRLAGRIVGNVAGARYEPSSVLAERALALIRHRNAGEEAAALDSVLVDAEGGGRASAGVDATVDAVNRGTVDRLYLLQTYEEDGRVCSRCHALQRAATAVCQWCSAVTNPMELGEAMVRCVLAADGDVASVDGHEGLARVGGVAALLRYPPR